MEDKPSQLVTSSTTSSFTLAGVPKTACRIAALGSSKLLAVAAVAAVR